VTGQVAEWLGEHDSTTEPLFAIFTGSTDSLVKIKVDQFTIKKGITVTYGIPVTDGEYVYIMESGKIIKYTKYLTYVSEVTVEHVMCSICYYNTKLYINSDIGILVYNCSDLSFDTYGGITTASNITSSIASDGIFLYIAHGGTPTLYRVDMSTFDTLNTTSIASPSNIDPLGLFINKGYLYVVTKTSTTYDTIRKHRCGSLAYVESVEFDGGHTAVFGDYVYISNSDGELFKLQISDMSIIAQSDRLVFTNDTADSGDSQLWIQGGSSTYGTYSNQKDVKNITTGGHIYLSKSPTSYEPWYLDPQFYQSWFTAYINGVHLDFTPQWSGSDLTPYLSNIEGDTFNLLMRFTIDSYAPHPVQTWDTLYLYYSDVSPVSESNNAPLCINYTPSFTPIPPASDMEFDSNGNVYIIHGSTVDIYSGYDLIASYSTSAYNLGGYCSVTVDQNGDFYVTNNDPYTSTIYKYSGETGSLISSIGSSYWTGWGIEYSRGIHYNRHNDRIYLCSLYGIETGTMSHSLYVYYNGYIWIPPDSWPQGWTGVYYDTTADIVTDSNDNWYIIDMIRFGYQDSRYHVNLRKINSSGSEVFTISDICETWTSGTHRYLKIALGADGNIYMTTPDSNILKVSSIGTVLATYAVSGMQAMAIPPGSSDIYVVANGILQRIGIIPDD
jgi:hypothetical protein